MLHYKDTTTAFRPASENLAARFSGSSAVERMIPSFPATRSIRTDFQQIIQIIFCFVYPALQGFQSMPLL